MEGEQQCLIVVVIRRNNNNNCYIHKSLFSTFSSRCQQHTHTLTSTHSHTHSRERECQQRPPINRPCQTHCTVHTLPFTGERERLSGKRLFIYFSLSLTLCSQMVYTYVYIPLSTTHYEKRKSDRPKRPMGKEFDNYVLCAQRERDIVPTTICVCCFPSLSLTHSQQKQRCREVCHVFDQCQW